MSVGVAYGSRVWARAQVVQDGVPIGNKDLFSTLPLNQQDGVQRRYHQFGNLLSIRNPQI
jgi:hypothetical protein